MVKKKIKLAFLRLQRFKGTSLVNSNKILKQLHFEYYHYSKPQASVQIPLLHYHPAARHTASTVYKFKFLLLYAQNSHCITIFYHGIRPTLPPVSSRILLQDLNLYLCL